MPHYLCAKCEHCGKEVVFQEVPNPEVHVDPTKWFSATCPHCEKEFGGIASDYHVITTSREARPPKQ